MASSNHSLLVSFLVLLSASSLISLASSAARCHSDDMRALLAIKAHFNNASCFDTWVPYNDWCYNWDNIDSDHTSGRVIGLTIVEQSVNGTIPTAIASLPFLESLLLRYLPGLTGPIPPALGKLHRLKNLELDHNSLSGPIPTSFSFLSSLTFLDLSFNFLSGSIPASIFLFPNLTVIDFSSNKLTGPLPPNLYLHVPDAVWLRLGNNKLTGEIPASYSQIKFAQVDLSGNKFTGDATLLFGRDKPMQYLDLSHNTFQFDLSKVVFPESALYSVVLNHNMIYGSIPQQINAVTHLNVFNVSYNRLCGPIPTGGQVSQFERSNYIHNKCLCGHPLPPCK